MNKILLILLSLFSLASCTTVFSGNTDDVTITTEPDNALVTIYGTPRGYTPLTVELEKGSSYNVTIEKEGYQSGYATISNKVGAGWVVLDILAGLIPIVIDAVTGAWGSLQPDHINLALIPVSAE